MKSHNFVPRRHFIILRNKKSTNAELTRCLKFAIKILILYRILVGEKKLSDLPYSFFRSPGLHTPFQRINKNAREIDLQNK